MALAAVFAVSVFKPWGRTHDKLEPGPKLRSAIAAIAVVGAAFSAIQSAMRRHSPELARGIDKKMVREQRVDVDGVTGATTTSRALQKAAENALRGKRAEQ